MQTTIRRAAAALTVGVPLLLASAGPALADTPRYEGEDPAPPLTALEAVLFYAGIPVAVVAVIVLLVMAPSWTRSGRYRPGMGWFAEPVWINGPADGEATPLAGLAVAGPPPASPDTTDAPLDQSTTGGASARW